MTFFIDRRGRLASKPVIGTVVNQAKGVRGRHPGGDELVTRALRLGGQAIALAAVLALLALLVWKVTHQQHAPKVGLAGAELLAAAARGRRARSTSPRYGASPSC